MGVRLDGQCPIKRFESRKTQTKVIQADRNIRKRECPVGGRHRRSCQASEGWAQFHRCTGQHQTRSVADGAAQGSARPAALPGDEIRGTQQQARHERVETHAATQSESKGVRERATHNTNILSHNCRVLSASIGASSLLPQTRPVLDCEPVAPKPLHICGPTSLPLPSCSTPTLMTRDVRRLELTTPRPSTGAY